MKMNMKKGLLSSIVTMAILFMSVQGFSQCKEWKWPADGTMKAKAEESVSLYTDYQKNSEFHKAVAPLNWLLVNTPDLNTSIYINGAEIYDKVADKEKDPAHKQVLVDSLMLIYDLRIKNCGEEGPVLNRKALSAAKYNINTNGKEAGVLALFDKVFEINGNNVMDGTLVPYMQVVKVNKLKLKNLTEDQILQRYDKVNEVIDAKIKKAQSEGKTVEKYVNYKGEVDKILISIVKVDCEFVRKNLAPKFKQNPADVALAKKIFSFMLQDNCTDDPLWLEAGEAIHKGGEKDFGLAKNLGKGYYRMEKFDKAEFYFKEAMELASTNADKSDVLILLGSNEARTGNKAQARNLFRQAADMGNKEGFEKIGDLYYSSYNDCAKKVSYAEDRLVYLAAYEMYAKSGNQQKMSQARAQFPSNTEIFEVNWKEGESKVVECWINESVTIKTRGKD
jgi:tetratricopeptide (TPR) repeat protein